MKKNFFKEFKFELSFEKIVYAFRKLYAVKVLRILLKLLRELFCLQNQKILYKTILFYVYFYASRLCI